MKPQLNQPNRNPMKLSTSQPHLTWKLKSSRLLLSGCRTARKLALHESSTLLWAEHWNKNHLSGNVWSGKQQQLSGSIVCILSWYSQQGLQQINLVILPTSTVYTHSSRRSRFNGPGNYLTLRWPFHLKRVRRTCSCKRDEPCSRDTRRLHLQR